MRYHIIIPFIINSGGKTALVGIETVIDLIRRGARRYSLDKQSVCHLSIKLAIQSSHCVTQWHHPNDIRNNLIGGAVAMAITSIEKSVQFIEKGLILYEDALDALMDEYWLHSPQRSDMDAELRLTLQAPITPQFPPREVGELVLWSSCRIDPTGSPDMCPLG